MMKLLFAIDSLGSGGAQRQMVTLALELKARGHHVEFFVYYPHGHYRALLDEAAVPVHLHLKASRFSVAPVIALRRLLAEQAFDCVLAFLDTPIFYAEMACLGNRRGTKLIVSERASYPPGKLARSKRLFQQLHRAADAITVNSHHQRKRMVHEFPWMTRKIETIYNGINLEYFSPSESNECGRDQRLSLVAVGTTLAAKNMLGLAKALTICRDRYKFEPLVRWVGKSDGGNGRREVESYLQEHGLGKQWEWLGERSNIPDILRQHDALVHPSFFEGLPNVICEALACGLPVLAGDVCDHAILVQEGVSGFLFDPSRPEDMAAAIYKLHQTSLPKRHAMSDSARAFAEENLSAALLADKYEALLFSLAGTKPER